MLHNYSIGSFLLYDSEHAARALVFLELLIDSFLYLITNELNHFGFNDRDVLSDTLLRLGKQEKPLLTHVLDQ